MATRTNFQRHRPRYAGALAGERGILGQRRDRGDAARARASATSRSNPGASYRGLHDSIVNYLGNRDAADGAVASTRRTRSPSRTATAKASDRMMAAALHANVGLMHATMAIYNAWCDRAPILMLGATGPWDATQAPPVDRLDPHELRPGRRSIRNFTKWDNQPGSPARGDGSGAARRADRADRAARARSTSTSTSRCRRRRSGRCRRCRTSRATPRRRGRAPGAGARRGRGEAALGREEPGHPRRPLLAQRRRLERARRARREAQRAACSPTSSSAAAFPDRSPPARRCRRASRLLPRSCRS